MNAITFKWWKKKHYNIIAFGRVADWLREKDGEQQSYFNVNFRGKRAVLFLFKRERIDHNVHLTVKSNFLRDWVWVGVIIRQWIHCNGHKSIWHCQKKQKKNRSLNSISVYFRRNALLKTQAQQHLKSFNPKFFAILKTIPHSVVVECGFWIRSVA